MASVTAPAIKQNLPMFTVQGPLVARCMLHGHKPCETRSVSSWKPGWYGLHVGKHEVKHDEVLEALKLSAREVTLPASGTLAKSAIVGLVKLAPAVSAVGVDHFWCIKSCGDSVYPIEASLAFESPLTDVSGAQGLWKVQDPQLVNRLREAASSASLQDHSQTPALLSMVSQGRGTKRPANRTRCFVYPSSPRSATPRRVPAARQVKLRREEEKLPSQLAPSSAHSDKQDRQFMPILVVKCSTLLHRIVPSRALPPFLIPAGATCQEDDNLLPTQILSQSTRHSQDPPVLVLLDERIPLSTCCPQDSPPPVQPDADFGFAFRSAVDHKLSFGRDPTEALLAGVHEATTERELHRAMQLGRTPVSRS